MKPEKADFTQARWLNKPQKSHITSKGVKFATEANTDFWQRTYYGFRNDNAPVLLLDSDSNFSFTVRTAFNYQKRFDQAGLMIYLDAENWFKASIEYEDADHARLGSVVTNRGYSDWATVDIKPTAAMWYRLHRRGPDFLIESSQDGNLFQQMRVFHLHALGETTADMAKRDPPVPPQQFCSFGVYACSPLDSSFEATFDHFVLQDCIWKAHK